MGIFCHRKIPTVINNNPIYKVVSLNAGRWQGAWDVLQSFSEQHDTHSKFSREVSHSSRPSAEVAPPSRKQGPSVQLLMMRTRPSPAEKEMPSS